MNLTMLGCGRQKTRLGESSRPSSPAQPRPFQLFCPLARRLRSKHTPRKGGGGVCMATKGARYGTRSRAKKEHGVVPTRVATDSQVRTGGKLEA